MKTATDSTVSVPNRKRHSRWYVPMYQRNGKATHFRCPNDSANMQLERIWLLRPEPRCRHPSIATRKATERRTVGTKPNQKAQATCMRPVRRGYMARKLQRAPTSMALPQKRALGKPWARAAIDGKRAGIDMKAGTIGGDTTASMDHCR